ncbi:unnamed protein product [Choristocarpus tenellus]
MWFKGTKRPTSTAEATSELDCQVDLHGLMDSVTEQKITSLDLWQRLDQYKASRETGSEAALATSLLEDVDLLLLFQAIDWAYRVGDENKSKLSGDALIRLLRSTVGAEILMERPEVLSFLLAGLVHQVVGVRRLTINAVRALGMGKEEGKENRCREFVDPPLLPAIVLLLGDEDVGVAQVAGATVVDLCKCGATERNSGFSVVLTTLERHMGEVTAGLTCRQAATPRLRFADTTARVAALSDAAFMAARDTGALSLVLSVAEDKDDILLRLNGLELLEQVAATRTGGRYLLAHGHLEALLVAAGAVGEEPPDPLLGPSALRVLAAVHAKTASMGAEAWAEVDPSLARAFLRACLIHMEALDETGKVAALVAASTMAGSSEASLKAVLEEGNGQSDLLDAWMTLSRHKASASQHCSHASLRFAFSIAFFCLI